MPNLNLKNFAKIKDSDFDIKDITVFAGKPGTGKSYVMKMLYAIDEAPSKLQFEKNYAELLINKVKELHNNKDFLEAKNILKKIDQIDSIGIPSNNLFTQSYKNLLESIFGNLNQISTNFLISHEDVLLEYKNDTLTTKMRDNSTPIYENTIFVETPLILELKPFMNRVKDKTPYHIESLLNYLDQDFSFTSQEQDKFIELFKIKAQEIIKGNIENGTSGLMYKTNNKDFNIINASSGIKSIGLLQYLVTNKALKKGSVLYWEEPEVHLHPDWQLKMIDLFIELMNAGVKIVFSTHSPLMADYLNAKSQKEKFSDRVSFNLLSEEDGVVSNTILDDNNWNLLQDELLNPLEEVMWEYL